MIVSLLVGPSPQFLIIMEYCEKGSLRQVLDTEFSDLSWTTKARMCLDTAQGLYRSVHNDDKLMMNSSLHLNSFCSSHHVLEAVKISESDPEAAMQAKP